MEIVISLAAYRSHRSAIEKRRAQMAELTDPAAQTYAAELQMLTRAVSALRQAQAKGDASEIAEWRDELEVLALYTDHFDILEGCRLALKAPSRRRGKPTNTRRLLGLHQENQRPARKGPAESVTETT